MNLIGVCNSSLCNEMNYHRPHKQSKSIGSIKLTIPIEQRRRPLECPDCKHALMWIKETQKARAGTKFGVHKKHVANREFTI
jgi:hypothetical protein